MKYSEVRSKASTYVIIVYEYIYNFQDRKIFIYFLTYLYFKGIWKSNYNHEYIIISICICKTYFLINFHFYSYLYWVFFFEIVIIFLKLWIIFFQNYLFHFFDKMIYKKDIFIVIDM